MADTGRTVVVGTAGHVDHGKSALVRALTGTDPDRLAEEKARGMTIDLGFAWTRLPGGTVASFVDVPGHEDFIRNMLAGAGGIDAVMLVVAADEGPMPQTHEHLAILDLLGVAHGVVALTKVDLVDVDWLALVTEEIEALIAGTTLAGVPVVPVSAVTGAGVADVGTALEVALARVPPAAVLGRPRLAVDRAFTISGFGTVVTGTLRDGTFRDGEAVEVLPAGDRVRIRGLQSHGHAVTEALPGTRTAINLAGLATHEIERGAVVALPGTYPATRLVDAMISVLPDAAAPIAHDDTVELFHGAAEIGARVRVIGAREIPPGARGPVQLHLDRPLVLAARDRFVLRQQSPSRTIGGGTVLDPCPPGRRRRLRSDTAERFAALDAGGPDDVAWHMLSEREPCPADALTAAATGLEPAARDAALAALAASGRARALGTLWITDAGWSSLRARAEAALERYHARFPLRPGAPSEELRERLDLMAPAFAAVVAAAAAEGWLVREGSALRSPMHRVVLGEGLEARAAALVGRFRASPYTPPSAKEAEEAVGPELLAAMIDRGDLVSTGGDVLFDRLAYAELVAGVLAHIDAHGQVTVADVRDRFDTSRKFALALLEHLDRVRVTRRVGDARVRGAAAATASGGVPGR